MHRGDVELFGRQRDIGQQRGIERCGDDLDGGKVPLGVGANTTIHRAIVDKNARIGRNVRIANQDNIQESTREELGFVIRNGIVVIIKNATIPDGMVV